MKGWLITAIRRGSISNLLKNYSPRLSPLPRCLSIGRVAHNPRMPLSWVSLLKKCTYLFMERLGSKKYTKLGSVVSQPPREECLEEGIFCSILIQKKQKCRKLNGEPAVKYRFSQRLPTWLSGKLTSGLIPKPRELLNQPSIPFLLIRNQSNTKTLIWSCTSGVASTTSSFNARLNLQHQINKFIDFY